MSKQEEIRKVLNGYVEDDCLYPDKDCKHRTEYNYCRSEDDAYRCLMRRLDELSVVIKAKRRLPSYPGDEAFDLLLCSDIYLNSQDDMLKAGYVAVEPLIKEGE